MAHSANNIHGPSNKNVTDEARLNTMFAQSIEAFVEATQESINNTVEEKLKDWTSGGNKNISGGAGNSSDKLVKSSKKEIEALHRKLASRATMSEKNV